MNSSKYYDELYDYAMDIVSKYEELLDCNLHVLPKGFFITFEFIFKIKKELSEEQFNKLGRNISQELYYFCKKFGVENNSVVVLSRYLFISFFSIFPLLYIEGDKIFYNFIFFVKKNKRHYYNYIWEDNIIWMQLHFLKT